MIWWGKRKPYIVMNWDGDSLQTAVDLAREHWQEALDLVDVREGNEEIDHSIYYLQLAQKRYMFLLQQAKTEHFTK